MAGDAVQVVYESHDGTLWIGTKSGMSRLRDGKFHNYSVRDGLLSDVVRCIYEDREGDLWIATGKGLNRLSQGGTMDAFAMPNDLPNDSVRAVSQDRGGRIWIGSNNGLLWYEWYWKIAFYAYNTKYGLSDTFVSAICEDDDGNLWVGTYSGLNRFRDGWFYSQPDADGQAFDRVNALFVDREGNLWVGSNEGLSRLTQQKFFTYTKQQGLTHNNIMSVMQDQTGSLWVGTWGGGLNQLQNERITAYASTNGLSQDLILSLCAGRDGSVWAGADFDGGLTRLKNGHVTHYTSTNGLINAGLRVLHEDQAGNLWIGTDRGMSCFADGEFVTNRLTERLAGIGVRDICDGGGNVLWIATQNGLYYAQGPQITSFTKADGLPDNSLSALLMDHDGTLWIGTSSAGLVRYRNGGFTTYTRRQGLFSDEIFGILEDDEGWLWMSCSQGIFRVRKQNLDDLDSGGIEMIGSSVYGKNDGMESPQCNGGGKPSAWKSSDGRLWFPTSKGLVVVDPKTVGGNRVPPAVFIESVVADAKTIENGRNNLAGAASVLRSRTAPLRVRPGQGELEFQYTALDFSAPEETRFKYRLDKVDGAWIDAGGRRVAYYNNLAPGTYRFEVTAGNRAGGWNPNGASMVVILLPHYWQTVWFRALLAVGVVGGVSGLALYSARKRMKRKLARLEQQQAVEKERGRIAKDMHDQIGAGLTQISLLGEFARRDVIKNGDVRTHVDRICDMSRELARTLDEIVWMVNPKNDTLNKLGIYLAAYAEEYFQATAIRCRLDIPPSLPALPIPTEVRHNLFLTVQEALNNIAKHSRASEARLGFVLNNSTLEIDVEDNGQGFSVAKADASRCGISNMRERIKAIGGELKISSQPQKGTRICLWIPLRMNNGQ
jgi:ligand-binding sensor domain-containing protein/signal transduction histidine kinase